MKKTVSKLSVFFIFAIIIPGSVLTYFSIQNISSQRELTEKRLLEEQNQLAIEFSEQFQKHLLMYTKAFFKDVDRVSSSLIDSMHILNSLDIVLQAFILDNKGQFLWPNYYESGKSLNISKVSHVFTKHFSSAETSEFTLLDLKKALQEYQEAFNTAASIQVRCAD